MVDGEIFDEFEIGCGAELPPFTEAPSRDGSIFAGWDGLPKLMPDSDVTVNAIFAKVAKNALDALLTDAEKESGMTVNIGISAVTEAPSLPTEIAEKYSKYVSPITLNIELSKGKDDSFEPLTETDELLSFVIDIPKEIRGKAEYAVIREHSGSFDVLSATANEDGEYIEVKDNTITIHAKKFSAYMLLAKDAEQTPSRRGGGGGGSSALTVRFETNGAAAINSLSVKKNTAVSEPTAPAKDGFGFDGWYTDKGLTKKFDFSTKITSSVTLYAKWIEKTKTSILLTIGKKAADINGKAVENDVAPMIVNSRTMLPIRFIAENLGAKVGWTEDPNRYGYRRRNKYIADYRRKLCDSKRRKNRT